MNTALPKRIKLPALSSKGEIRLNARAVSRGFAVGKIVCLHGKRRQFYKVNIETSHIEREIRRFRAAARLAMRRLKKIIADHPEKIKAGIFDAHLLLLADKSLHANIEKSVSEQKINAEWAIKTVTDNYIAKYKAVADVYLRERYVDLEDVAERLLTALGGSDKSKLSLGKNSIIVAREVRPSTLIELAASQPLAIITENGGWTSHTFILAREMNLPSVTGVKRILRRVENGDEAIVDGFGGQIILNPSAESRGEYKLKAREFQKAGQINDEPIKGQLRTLDGVRIKIRANLDLAKGYGEAKRFGAEGIGLYRSELLFNQFKGFPTESEQIAAYRKVAGSAGAEGVRIRTFDLSVEQIADDTGEREKNPALGLRAVRLSLTHPNEFRVQIRAILQAAIKDNISVVLPMISDVAEIRRVKKIIESEKEKLKRQKIAFGILPLGAMIEVPSAVLTIEEIASEVEFLCLGTNDLVQYLLAVDRDNEAVADWFHTLHPAVLRALKRIFEAAEKQNIPAVVCGEMAGSPVYVPILLGLGARELSMNVYSMPRVRRIAANIALEESRELVQRLEKCRTAAEIELTVGEFYREKWTHLFPEDAFPTKKKNEKTKKS